MEIFDVTVIGGGPSGLFALFYAGMRGAKAKVIDVLPELGGQLYALYPEKYIYDMPGFPAIVAQDLVKGCVDQAFQWPHAKCLEERVTDIARDEDGAFTVVTDKDRHRTRAIVLTTGIGAFSPRKLAAPSAERFEGSGLHYYARAFDEFAGLRVTIVGGGDSAVDYALALEPRAASVAVVHRSAFRAHASTVDRLRASRVQIHQPDFEVEEVHGDARVSAVTIVNKVQEGRPDIVDDMRSGRIQLIFNTTEGAQAIADSFSLRRTALTHNIPYYTTVAGARAAVQAIGALRRGSLEVAPLQSYF